MFRDDKNKTTDWFSNKISSATKKLASETNQNGNDIFNNTHSDWFAKSSDQQNKHNDSLQHKQITSNKTLEQDNSIKPLGQLLSEIILGKDVTSTESNQQHNTISDDEITKYTLLEKDKFNALEVYETIYQHDKNIRGLIKQYKSILQYQTTFSTYNEMQIKHWTSNRATSCEITEFIAILYRAVQLIDKHQLRDSQILALLAFLNTEQDKGRLCQILTGEGKTNIVALLAIIKATRGEKVDIITSNPVLAQEAVNEKSKLYALFNLTVSTNNIDEKKTYIEGEKSCYNANVVYGCISNYQFDYLRDSVEGLKTRGGRPFNVAILDEVDSMIIDNGRHIAKLSSPLPGMEYLRYIYINIWNALKNINETDLGVIKNKLIQEKNNFIPSELIPGHLLAFAESCLERWIENAIYAKFNCHLDRQYVIKEKDGEDIVIPVDYANTGVTLKDTIWSYGLHQFVQLKHGLHIQPESLTSSFISNLGYIKKYNNHIYGLTGTLGSVNEQALLSDVYHIDYAKIPSFKMTKFIESQGLIAESNTEWLATIVSEISQKVLHEKRAVLVIAETIADANDISQTLNELFKTYYSDQRVKIRTYLDEDIIEARKEDIDIGHIIISTNIAGRGTDLRTTELLEKHGGLHVCVGFLPRNKRVEQQAFGRTARQGKKGTAQLIIRSSETTQNATSIEQAKEIRDRQETDRLSFIRTQKLAEINFDDNIFKLFSEQYSSFKMKNKDDAGSIYLCNDLSEWWAVFLEELSRSDRKSINYEVKFMEFYNHKKTQTILNNKSIGHNPYNGIKLAEEYIKKEQHEKAKEALDNALVIAGKNTALLYSAYLKYFELSIESGHALEQRIFDALGKIFSLNVKKNTNYIIDAKNYLEKAKLGITAELNFIDPGKNKNPYVAHFGARSLTLQTFYNNIEQLMAMLSGQDNNHLFELDNNKFKEHISIQKDVNMEYPFLQHMATQKDSLQELKPVIHGQLSPHMNQQEIEKIWKEITPNLNEKIKTTHNQGNGANAKEDFIIALKQNNYFFNIDKNDQSQRVIVDNLKKRDVFELYFIGLESIYGLKKIHALHQIPINVAKAEMIAGIAFEAIAAALLLLNPASAKQSDTLAGLFISESITSLIAELVNGGEKFNEEQYKKNKLISYSISLSLAVIGGIAALANISQHIAKVKSAFMEKSKNLFKNIKLPNAIKPATPTKIPAPPKVVSSTNKPPAFYQNIIGKIKRGAQNTALNQATDKILTPLLKELFKEIRLLLEKKVREIFAEKINKNQLQNIGKNNAEKASMNILNEINTSTEEVAKQVAQGMASQYLQTIKSNKLSTNIAAYGLGTLVGNALSVPELIHYCDEYCDKLNRSIAQYQPNRKENIEEIMRLLVEQVVNKLYSLIIGIITSLVRDSMIDPMLQRGPHIPDKNNTKRAEPAETDKKQLTEPISTIAPTAAQTPANKPLTNHEREKPNLTRRHSTPDGDVLNGRRDLDLLNKGATGQVQLALLAANFGYPYIKCTILNKDGSSKIVYYDKEGAIVTDKTKKIDEEKIPWVQCEVGDHGELAHFTSTRTKITPPDSERNCGPIAIFLEHERLKGRSTHEIQHEINENPNKFLQRIEELSIQSSRNVIHADPEKLQENIQHAKDHDAFQPGHGVEFDGNTWKKTPTRDAATPKKNQPHLKKDFETRTGRNLPSSSTGAFLAMNGLSGNHRISDKNIQDIILNDLKQGEKNGQYGILLNKFLDVFAFSPQHADRTLINKYLSEYSTTKDNKVREQCANRIIKLLSQHPGQISLGNASQNSAIGEHLDLHAPKHNGQHSLSPRSRHILTALTDSKNKDLLPFIDEPKRDGHHILSSQYGDGGDKNKSQQNINLLHASPETKRLFDAFSEAKKAAEQTTLKRKRSH